MRSHHAAPILAALCALALSATASDSDQDDAFPDIARDPFAGVPLVESAQMRRLENAQRVTVGSRTLLIPRPLGLRHSDDYQTDLSRLMTGLDNDRQKPLTSFVDSAERSLGGPFPSSKRAATVLSLVSGEASHIDQQRFREVVRRFRETLLENGTKPDSQLLPQIVTQPRAPDGATMCSRDDACSEVHARKPVIVATLKPGPNAWGALSAQLVRVEKTTRDNSFINLMSILLLNVDDRLIGLAMFRRLTSTQDIQNMGQNIRSWSRSILEFNGYEKRREVALRDIRLIDNALNLYKVDNFRYPTQAQGLDALLYKPRNGPEPSNYEEGGYLERLPNDPWGNSYQYHHPTDNNDLRVYSLGADGTPGGEGTNADLGNWDLDS